MTVETRLEDLKREADRLHAGLMQTADEVRDRLIPELQRLERELRGWQGHNGNPPDGLLTDVAKLRDKIERTKAIQAEQQDAWRDAARLRDECLRYARENELINGRNQRTTTSIDSREA